MFIKAECIDLGKANLIVQNIVTFTKNKKSLLYIDGTNAKAVCRKAREFFGSDYSKNNIMALAIFANSKYSRFMANFILNVNFLKYKIPGKIFAEKEEAIDWLKSFKQGIN